MYLYINIIIIYLECKTPVPLSSSSSYLNDFSCEDADNFSDTSGSVFSDNDEDEDDEDDDQYSGYARDNFLASL